VSDTDTAVLEDEVRQSARHVEGGREGGSEGRREGGREGGREGREGRKGKGLKREGGRVGGRQEGGRG
jgi:hypothetical protein